MSTVKNSPAWRWRVAALLNRLPRQCWADLIEWALPWTSRAEERRNPWSPITGACTQGAPKDDPTWRCYCGKVGADGKAWRDPEVTR